MNLFRKLMIVVGVVVAVPLLLLGALLVKNAYDRHRLDARMHYWSAQMAQGLPRGMPVAGALAFFRTRGVTLECVQDIADGSQSCGGREGEDYGVLPTWHIRFRLEFSDDDTLVSAERIALGVGL